jgi:hypothetical protein
MKASFIDPGRLCLSGGNSNEQLPMPPLRKIADKEPCQHCGWHDGEDRMEHVSGPTWRVMDRLGGDQCPMCGDPVDRAFQPYCSEECWDIGRGEL